MDKQPINCIFIILAINNRFSDRCKIPVVKHLGKNLNQNKSVSEIHKLLPFSVSFRKIWYKLTTPSNCYTKLWTPADKKKKRTGAP